MCPRPSASDTTGADSRERQLSGPFTGPVALGMISAEAGPTTRPVLYVPVIRNAASARLGSGISQLPPRLKTCGGSEDFRLPAS
jgi:hypothetical protein